MALARLFAKALIALAFVTLAAAWPQGRAHAQAATGGWSVCNQTSFLLEAVAGRPERNVIRVQGWFRLRPGECRVLGNPPLVRGVYYLYARSSPAHRGGRRQWGGPTTLCIDPNRSFLIDNPPKCQSANLEERGFREVRINKRDGWRTVLGEANNYSLARARAEGLQRLLSDAGYEAADGDARRFGAAIGRFRQEARLAANATEEQLIDALEQTARRRAERVGLRLCSGAQGRMWVAIARRRGEGWESRGWWSLGPNACVRTIDESLAQGLYFIHAVLETPEGDRYLAAPGETFCTARTRFAVLGRQACAERFYDDTMFAAIRPPAGAEGMEVRLTEKDFLEPGLKPRRSEDIQLGRDAPIISADEGQTVEQGRARVQGQQGSIRDLATGAGPPRSASPGARVTGAIPAPPLPEQRARPAPPQPQP